MWLDTIPAKSKDQSKKLYLFFYDPHRKTTRRIVTKFHNRYPDKLHAKRFLKKMEADAANNKFQYNFPFADAPLLSEAFEKFFKSRLTETTAEQYRYCFNSFISIVGDKPLTEYKKQDGIDFIKHLKNSGKSDNTIASYTKQMKIIWNWLREELPEAEGLRNIITTQPWKKSAVKTIPPEDLKRIFEHFRKQMIEGHIFYKDAYRRHYKIIRILYLTGFRPSSLALLKSKDIRMKEDLIYYRNKKEEKDSTFPLHNELKKEFADMDLSREGLVFNRFDKKTCFWNRAMKTLNMHYTIKMLRKTLATEISRKISSCAAAIILDHEDKKITEDYYIAQFEKDPIIKRAVMEKLRKDINSKIKFVK